MSFILREYVHFLGGKVDHIVVGKKKKRRRERKTKEREKKNNGK